MIFQNIFWSFVNPFNFHVKDRPTINMQGEGHSAAGWNLQGHGGSVIAADCEVQSPGSELTLIALRHLISLPVSTLRRVIVIFFVL